MFVCFGLMAFEKKLIRGIWKKRRINPYEGIGAVE